MRKEQTGRFHFISIPFHLMQISVFYNLINKFRPIYQFLQLIFRIDETIQKSSTNIFYTHL